MKKTTILMFLAMMPIFLMAQFYLKGKITDESTGKSLPGAHVVILNSYLFSIANEDGSFQFQNLKPGNYLIKISFVGFDDYHQSVDLHENLEMKIPMKPRIVMEDEVVIMAGRASAKSPQTFVDITKKEINAVNIGKDLPYLLEMTPGAVVTSDAGAGVGYTGLRIRGTDITRINVTINGIPLNDPESHGVFWVNMPDFLSSVDNVQVQRGVGTSSNGAAAFGASINIQTQKLRSDPFVEIGNTLGSYNTWRSNVSFGTGLIDGKFTLDGRLSKISSDGYIDRASSDLKSFFLSGGYYGENSIVKFNVFSGCEKTYQSWNGVPSDSLKTNRTFNSSGLYYDETGKISYYDNETDNYQQDHYQFLWSKALNRNVNINASLFYVKGRGYYENYKEDEEFDEYGLNDLNLGDDTIFSTDLIRRKYLDNDFYGLTFSSNYNNFSNVKMSFGGSYNHYSGDHFGKIIWAQFASNSAPDKKWYDNSGVKKQFDLFGKVNYQITKPLNLYADLQLRGIDYEIEGIHDNLLDISQQHHFLFFNPKLGMFYEIGEKQKAYFSFGISNREPSRSDYRDADANHEPQPERLYDFEAGYSINSNKFVIQANLFYMNYSDQLVLTGEINNVGSPIFTNIDKSYRAGIELTAGWKISGKLEWEANASFSRNKALGFTEFVDNWSEPYGQIQKNLGTTDLAFSPNFIAGSSFNLNLVKNLNLEFNSKFVGKQFIDNTSNEVRSLDAWFVNDLIINYSFTTNFIRKIDVSLAINNLFSEKYESNAWIYRYYYEGAEYYEDGYFPQAPVNFMAGVTLGL